VFLKTINKEVPPGLHVHLILDNYATHKHPDVKAWLAKNPRFQLHFTPTSSSWLNLVERWFPELTDKALRRGAFHSVPDLITKIEDYLAANNTEPKPLVWTATADSILKKVARGRVALETIKHMAGIWDKVSQSGANTVIATVAWDQVEPLEGSFDFSNVEELLEAPAATQPASVTADGIMKADAINLNHNYTFNYPDGRFAQPCTARRHLRQQRLGAGQTLVAAAQRLGSG